MTAQQSAPADVAADSAPRLSFALAPDSASGIDTMTMETEQIPSKSILALTPEEYDAAASRYSKNAIFLWCVSGGVYISLSNDHRLLSLVTLLLFMPGIFVASFASIPFFFASTKLKARVAQLQPYPAPRAFFVLTSTTVLFVAFTAMQIVLPIVFVKLCARLL